MPIPTKKKWDEVALCFWSKTNFPHCLGAIDGKHITLIKPCHNRSRYFNYKKIFFLIVLMAVVNADYKYFFVDIEAFGSCADSTVFQNSKYGKSLAANQLDLPDNRPLAGIESPAMPFVFVADEAFAVNEHLMKLYSETVTEYSLTGGGG